MRKKPSPNEFSVTPSETDFQRLHEQSQRLRVPLDTLLAASVSLGLLAMENSRVKDNGDLETIVINPRISPDFDTLSATFDTISATHTVPLALRELTTHF